MSDEKCPACGGPWEILNDGAYCFDKNCTAESGHWTTDDLVGLLSAQRKLMLEAAEMLTEVGVPMEPIMDEYVTERLNDLVKRLEKK